MCFVCSGWNMSTKLLKFCQKAPSTLNSVHYINATFNFRIAKAMQLTWLHTIQACTLMPQYAWTILHYVYLTLIVQSIGVQAHCRFSHVLLVKNVNITCTMATPLKYDVGINHCGRNNNYSTLRMNDLSVYAITINSGALWSYTWRFFRLVHELLAASLSMLGLRELVHSHVVGSIGEGEKNAWYSLYEHVLNFNT